MTKQVNNYASNVIALFEHQRSQFKSISIGTRFIILPQYTTMNLKLEADVTEVLTFSVTKF